MKQKMIHTLTAVCLALSLVGCAGQGTVEGPLPSAMPTTETSTPSQTPAPTPSPTPTPSLSPMERKYAHYDPEGAQLGPCGDDPGVLIDRDSVEYELAECLYGTWYWDDDDTMLVIGEETLDGREYCIHGLKEYFDADALSMLFSYADEPDELYRLDSFSNGYSPSVRAVEIYPVNDGSSSGERMANEYSWAEMEELYEKYSESSGGGGQSGSDSSVPDGTVAYFRFLTEIGKYKVENGQYVLQQAWSWVNNEVVDWDSTGRPTRRTTNNSLPPVETNIYYCLPDSFSATDCPYESCPSSTIDEGYRTAMFSTQDNS